MASFVQIKFAFSTVHLATEVDSDLKIERKTSCGMWIPEISGGVLFQANFTHVLKPSRVKS